MYPVYEDTEPLILPTQGLDRGCRTCVYVCVVGDNHLVSSRLVVCPVRTVTALGSRCGPRAGRLP